MLLNSNLPTYRPTLQEILENNIRELKLRNSSSHFFSKDELEFLSSLLDEEEKKQLRLPILLYISPEKIGKGLVKVSGKVEVKVISKLLGRCEDSNELLFPKAELIKIRKKLKTTTQHVFL